MSGCLLLGDPSSVHQCLHVGVIVRELHKFVIAEQIRARVTDVNDGDSTAEPIQPGHGRSHTREVRFFIDDGVDGFAGGVDRIGQGVEEFRR